MKIFRLAVLSLVIPFTALAQPSQQYKNWWFFGYGAGCEFTSGNPVANVLGQTAVEEGTAVMSDNAGNLMFYTEGLKVWNKNHVVMPNGNGLLGNPSSTQSALIVPRPGNPNQYYLFTVWPGSGLRYSVVDMTLNGGLGDIVAIGKNTLLGATNVDEKLTGTRHANGVDWWIVVHMGGSSNYVAWLATAAGVASPVTSACGPSLNGAIGYMNMSPCGKWIGLSNYNPSLGVASFNNATGQVTNYIDLSNGSNYSSGFSPDGTKFYHWTYTPQNAIWEVDLNQGTQTAINASRVQIATASNWFGAFVNGKNGKMYIPSYATGFMHVINNPNGMGGSVGYQANAISLSGKIARLALPNFIEIVDTLKYNIAAVPAGCGSSTGSATVSVTSGGISPYTYSWSGGGGSNANATGLNAGTYTVTIKDASGCKTETKTVNITQTGGTINATAASTNVLCGGTATGTASVTATGGTGTLTYSWNPSGGSTANATGLTAGGYTITITDSNGCSSTKTVSVTQPAPLVLNTATTNATCTSLGNIATTVTGGTGSYTYNWSNSQTGANATGLAQGNYSLTVTDANGCTQTASATISGTPGPTGLGFSNITNVLCNGGNTGAATASAAGGTGALTWTWSSGQSTANINTLTAGNYTVTVSDANGCTLTTVLIITEPQALLVTTTGNNVCSGTAGSVQSTATGGTGAYNYVWNNGQNTQNATGLTAGNYTITVTDANSCISSATAALSNFISPVPTFTVDDSAGCVALCVNFTNTTANTASYSFVYGDSFSGNGTGNNVINHCYKTPGVYSITLTVTDNNGCTGSITKNNYINVYPNVVAAFTAGPQPTTILNPIINFNDQSSGGANSWKWTFGDLLTSTSTLQNPTFNYKDSGCYVVQLIADNQYNCPDTANDVICIRGDYELFAPNAFTPNGSGPNDTWNVQGIGIDPNHFELYIFDRWGSLIFKTTDLFQGWDGRANGGKDIAQQDVYVWKVFTRDFEGGKHNYVGHVSLLR